jgi:aerobic-type carbon monoxide dehydrogenase small subunit (CoxS/CutS family)/xanthine dehydrogenase molybdopterin-binding subunit B
VGCDTAQCGACTVLVNGRAIKSCNTLAAQHPGAEITTIEGLAEADGTMHPMQAAFKECHGLQCGFCTPGMVMSAIDLCKNHPNASDTQIREQLEGNICRCTGYQNIVKAVQVGQKAMASATLPEQQETAMGASDFSKLPHIGEALRRKEDYRFLTGAGQYTDDIQLANQRYAVFVRSPHAHAAIQSIDVSRAEAMPGVRKVFTGKDVEGKMGGLPCGWLITSTDGTPMKEPPHPILAQGKVRYVGDHVAMVVADTLEQAERGRGGGGRLRRAARGGQRARCGQGHALHDAAPDNQCYSWAIGDKAQVDAVFAKAAHVTKLDLVNNRLVPNPMEPRAAIGSFNRANDEYTLYVSNQNPHVERLLMTAFVLGLPEHKVRVIAPDVGGGFGAKIFLYAEDVALTWAAKQLNCAIKWTCDRSEAFLCDAQGRDHVSHAEMAMDKDGKFLALRVKTDANLGAYLSTFSTAVPTILYATLLAGQYATPQIHVEVDAWFTNTAPVDAYRGAGRPEATYLLERLVTRCAWEMGLGAGRDPQAQLHHHLPVPDAGGAAVRHRRLPRVHGQGQGAGRRRGLRGAPQGQRGQGL